MPRTASFWGDVHNLAFEQGYADAAGVRTRYIRAGDPAAPAIIFLHGTGGHAEAFMRNLSAHAAHFNTYLVDCLGHGWTDKPDRDYEIPDYVEHLAAFMDGVGLATASICGESLGGWIAAAFAVAHPERVEKLVLNTAGGLTSYPEVMKAIREKTLAAMDDPEKFVRPRLEWLMADPATVTDDLVACRQRIYSNPEMKKAMLRILCLQDPEIRQRNLLSQEMLSKIRAKTLVVWTTHDPTAPVEIGEKMAGWIAGSRFVVMSDCGHWPQFEDPDTYNRLSLEFLCA